MPDWLKVEELFLRIGGMDMPGFSEMREPHEQAGRWELAEGHCPGRV